MTSDKLQVSPFTFALLVNETENFILDQKSLRALFPNTISLFYLIETTLQIRGYIYNSVI